MNDTVIGIKGVSVNVIPVSLENSIDMSYLVSFKDDYGNMCYIYIVNEKIVNVQWLAQTK